MFVNVISGHNFWSTSYQCQSNKLVKICILLYSICLLNKNKINVTVTEISQKRTNFQVSLMGILG